MKKLRRNCYKSKSGSEKQSSCRSSKKSKKRKRRLVECSRIKLSDRKCNARS